MPSRIEVHDAPDVLRPAHSSWILRTRNNELFFRQLTCGLTEQLFQLRLPVGRVGPHVTQVACEPALGLPVAVLFRIERTVERHRTSRSEALLQFAQHFAAGKTKIEIESWNLLSQQIVGIGIGAKTCQSDRRVDVVKSLYPGGRFEYLVNCGNSVRKIGAYNCNIRVSELPPRPWQDLLPALKKMHFTERRLRQVAIRFVP